MKIKLLGIIVILLILLKTTEGLAAPAPNTVFFPICWEPLKVEGIDKDYIRFHMGYWSSGGEEFKVSIQTASSYASWGSLHHDTTSIWKTSPGTVDDMTLTVYAQDTYNPDRSPIVITFTSNYHKKELHLSVVDIDPCINPWPSWNNNIEPQIEPLIGTISV